MYYIVENSRKRGIYIYTYIYAIKTDNGKYEEIREVFPTNICLKRRRGNYRYITNLLFYFFSKHISITCIILHN